MLLAGIYCIQRVISLLRFFTESQFKAKLTEFNARAFIKTNEYLYIKINKLRIQSKTSLFMWGSSNIFQEHQCELKKESYLRICFCFLV